jgi:tetratricopeptide (TPR) repeat protein
MTGQLLDEEPELALAHAVAARRLASRIGVVREAVGLAAYRAGEWQTAISEIRTYHRMSGKQTHLAILADCERAMGRPEKAIDIFRSFDRAATNSQESIELLIVAAGARRDLGQGEAAVSMLQIRELTSDEPWTARLRYAYADALQAGGRRDEAREWFARAVDADPDGETDAADRLLDIDGITLEEDDMDDPELALAEAHDEMDDRAEAEHDRAHRDVQPQTASDADTDDADEDEDAEDADADDDTDDTDDADDVDDDDDDEDTDVDDEDEDDDDTDDDDDDTDDDDDDDTDDDDDDTDDDDDDTDDDDDDDDDDTDDDDDEWEDYKPVTPLGGAPSAATRDPFTTESAHDAPSPNRDPDE